jgi:hypothetical protein
MGRRIGVGFGLLIIASGLYGGITSVIESGPGVGLINLVVVVGIGAGITWAASRSG